MFREKRTPRYDWQTKVESLGFMFHQVDESVYWDESAAYVFDSQEIEILETAANTLYEMCVEAVDWCIQSNSLSKLKIPQQFHELIKKSWQRDDPSIVGRFDLRYDGINPPKMYEFNSDTPTSLLEASVVQWDWLQECLPTKDQFNGIHEQLLAGWQEIGASYPQPFYFTCVKDHLEDLSNIEYLRDVALQSNIDTRFIYIEDLGWNSQLRKWVDMDGNPCPTICKLYPWEWLAADSFGVHLVHEACQWIEPAWKWAMSSKALLPVLWQMFPNHPNLLKASFEDNSNHFPNGRAKKPIYSREGANVELKDRIVLERSEGDYGSEGYIYQELSLLPDFHDDNHNYFVHPVLGVWMINGQACGLGIRETDSYITDNTSRFIPHYISY